uniref:T-cell immunoglobulin and mucin domain-containing protein 4-like n=1 Tax=Mastacembelus armatus TaxID=205130 RepID=A0A3Q3S658_9TELE
MTESLYFPVSTAGECGSSSRVVGRTGQNVTLPCQYDIKAHGAQPVCWNRGALPRYGCNPRLVASDGYNVMQETRVSSRFQLLGRLDRGDVSLTVLNIAETDAGWYGCRVRVPGWFNDKIHNIDLIIERAPVTAIVTGQTGSDVTTRGGSDVTTRGGT